MNRPSGILLQRNKCSAQQELGVGEQSFAGRPSIVACMLKENKGGRGMA